jgi:hypothetical protein
MAFDPHQVERIRLVLKRKKVAFIEKKMIGGMCFMVDEKMCMGTHIDKTSGASLLMARIGAEATSKNLSRPGCRAMDFTGRVMKDYVFVTAEGLDSEEDLEYWVSAALDFNPFAKASKKKVPKIKKS